MNKRHRIVQQKTVFIFTEGESEEIYLNRLKRRGTGYRVNIKKMNERNVSDLITRSHTSACHSGLSEGDEVYVVFDADVYDIGELETAERLADSLNVALIISNPCFEVWLLYHFSEKLQPAASDEYEVLLSAYLPKKYRKSEGIGVIDQHTLANAIERSKGVCKSTKAVDIKNTPCCTSMHKLVERLIKDD